MITSVRCPHCQTTCQLGTRQLNAEAFTCVWCRGEVALSSAPGGRVVATKANEKTQASPQTTSPSPPPHPSDRPPTAGRSKQAASAGQSVGEYLTSLSIGGAPTSSAAARPPVPPVTRQPPHRAANQLNASSPAGGYGSTYGSGSGSAAPPQRGSAPDTRGYAAEGDSSYPSVSEGLHRSRKASNHGPAVATGVLVVLVFVFAAAVAAVLSQRPESATSPQSRTGAPLKRPLVNPAGAASPQFTTEGSSPAFSTPLIVPQQAGDTHSRGARPYPGSRIPNLPAARVPTPSVPRPSIPSTRIPAPGIGNPGIPDPPGYRRKDNPGRTTPGIPTPGIGMPGRTNPGRTNPGRTNPGRMTPGRMTPGRMTPGRMTPGFGASRTPPAGVPGPGVSSANPFGNRFP